MLGEVKLNIIGNADIGIWNWEWLSYLLINIHHYSKINLIVSYCISRRLSPAILLINVFIIL